MSEQYTERDGWAARWRLDKHYIRIMVVRRVSDPEPLVSATGPASAPDLAEMRERFPNLSRLWDAIRQEYWSECFTSRRYSHGTL